MTPQGVRLVVDSLVSQQLVTVLGHPRAQLFTIEMGHPLAATLKRLFQEEQARWDALLGALQTKLEQFKSVKAAWYYGSVARGEDDPSSDLDIVIVVAGSPVDDTLDAVREGLRDVEKRMLVSCSVVGLSTGDVTRLSAGDAWWRKMVRDAKVLKGGRPEQAAARTRRSMHPA